MNLNKYGIFNPKCVLRNASPAVLTEIALQEDGRLTDTGALLIETGKYTGRSPNDRFIVRDSVSENLINWGKGNLPISEKSFDRILAKIQAYLTNRNIYVFDGFAGADKKYRLPIRCINEFASQNLFMNNMLIHPTEKELKDFKEEFTLICAPSVRCVPKQDGTNSEAAIIINLKKKMIIITGSRYCGEMKKSVFSTLNAILPGKDVFPMHCSANMAKDGSGDTALFFGLSGTGKTTLSADPNRGLIGDDEHGWSNNGIFNFEGGCYAKTIKLSPTGEPEIYNAIRHGALVENVIVDKETRHPDYDDATLTENTRVSYPLSFIPNAVIPSVGGHPKTVVFLTADAFGVLPPVAKLTKEQAMYYFVSGYTSKLAGTERGVKTPEPTFSSCFGAPFMLLPISTYAQQLGKKIEKFNPDVYLINTGWTGGKYGVGKRMSLKDTRAIVTAALNGSLRKQKYQTEPFFGLNIPLDCPGCDKSVLNPRNTWKNKSDYDKTAKELAKSFIEGFKKYEQGMPKEIIEAGPRIK